MATSRFRWEESKIENLIKCLLEYKTCMAFKNCDWNADKVKLYENVRKSLAKIYEDEPEQFGPVSLSTNPHAGIDDDDVNDVDLKEYQIKIKTEKELIKRGYARVQEKVKVLRQKFSEAVTTGRRSGSGQIVMEHYDDLVKLWGGSPASQPLCYGCSTSEVNYNVNSEDNLSGDPCCSSTSTPSTRKRKKITAANNENNENYDPYSDEDSTSETITSNESLTDEFIQRSTPISKNKKQKLETNIGKNPVPKLIDIIKGGIWSNS